MVTTYTPVNKDVDPDLPVRKRLANILPLKFPRLGDLTLRSLALALELQAVDHKGPLLLGQECGGLREVVQQPERRHSHEDRQDALKDEDPPPTREVSDAVHLANGKREEAAKGARHRRRREEHGLAKLDLVAAVPHGEVVLEEPPSAKSSTASLQCRNTAARLSAIRPKTPTSQHSTPQHD